jgi:hypothetical protein
MTMLGRRAVIKRIAATAILAPTVITKAVADEKTLVVYNFDGVLGKHIKETWIDPFAADNGVKIDVLTMQGSSPPMAKVKAQIDRKHRTSRAPRPSKRRYRTRTQHRLNLRSSSWRSSDMVAAAGTCPTTAKNNVVAGRKVSGPTTPTVRFRWLAQAP